MVTQEEINENFASRINHRLEEIEELEKWLLSLSKKVQALESRIDDLEVLMLKNGFYGKERLPEHQLEAERSPKSVPIPLYKDGERRL